MKKQVMLFIYSILLIMAILPISNLIMQTGSIPWNKTALYNLDVIQPLFSRMMYTLGISIDPAHVLIGKNNWLYLGDAQENTLSVKRIPTTTAMNDIAKNIGLATQAWTAWFKSKGVRRYQMMLTADKDSVYPEFLPTWMQPTTTAYATDSLFSYVNPETYLDTRALLKHAKSQFSQPLYYKTDSHWNSLGAWLAFQKFMAALVKFEAEIHTPTIHISEIMPRIGGDLSKFLKIKTWLTDSEVNIEILSKLPIETTQYNFDTGKLLTSGGNPAVPMSRTPLLITSEQALNKKKVLWLRDSFGRALSPFMAATFSEVLQIHYDAADPAQLAKLVERFKPDYVFVTVVERAALSKRFTELPPS